MWRRDVERHFGYCQRLETAPQAFKFGIINAGAGAPGVDEPAIRIVLGEQQSAEPGPGAFGIGPADHEAKASPNKSAAFTSPARCQADSKMD